MTRSVRRTAVLLMLAVMIALMPVRARADSELGDVVNILFGIDSTGEAITVSPAVIVEDDGEYICVASPDVLDKKCATYTVYTPKGQGDVDYADGDEDMALFNCDSGFSVVAKTMASSVASGEDLELYYYDNNYNERVSEASITRDSDGNTLNTDLDFDSMEFPAVVMTRGGKLAGILLNDHCWLCLCDVTGGSGGGTAGGSGDDSGKGSLDGGDDSGKGGLNDGGDSSSSSPSTTTKGRGDSGSSSSAQSKSGGGSIVLVVAALAAIGAGAFFVIKKRGAKQAAAPQTTFPQNNAYGAQQPGGPVAPPSQTMPGYGSGQYGAVPSAPVSTPNAVPSSPVGMPGAVPSAPVSTPNAVPSSPVGMSNAAPYAPAGQPAPVMQPMQVAEPGPTEPVLPAAPVAPQAPMLSVCCVDGELAGRNYPMMGQEFTIGRDPSCDICYSPDTKGVSRRHCRIFWQNGILSIEDLGSTSGTYIRGKGQITPNMPVPVNAGDTFYLGEKANAFEIRMG